MSPELYYNVIHKESMMFLKELYQLGLKESGALWLPPPQTTMDRKKAEETFRCEQSIFYGKRKMT